MPDESVPNGPETAPADPSAEHPNREFAMTIEAVLLSMDRPVTPARLAGALRAADDGADNDDPALARRISACIDELNAEYESTGRAFRIESVAGSFRVMTLPRFAPAIAAFQQSRARATLTPASLETLAIVAYKQPITRAQLESIRGVACGEVLRSLTERRLITIAGRAEELGRPLLYGTTKQFLELFGLGSLKDLPSPDELRQRLAAADEERSRRPDDGGEHPAASDVMNQQGAEA